MNVLCIGDVIGSAGIRFLSKKLPAFKRNHKIDLVIANGENSSDTNGITPASAASLFECGVDVITTGNHCFQRYESYDLYDTNEFVLRPANYPQGFAPGSGMCIVDMGRARVAVINLQGVVSMSPLDCPFQTADELLEEIDTPFVIVDFHAEATAEKRCLARYLSGRISALFGTHTHVQTADEQVMCDRMGYITDVGMTGPVDSCIGADFDIAVKKMTSHMPMRLEYATGQCSLCAVIFTLDSQGNCTAVERINEM